MGRNTEHFRLPLPRSLITLRPRDVATSMETIDAISPAREHAPDVPLALTVSELTRLLRDTVRGNPLLSRVLVRGETSNVQRAPSNLVFFTLKDANAQIGCVLFREEAEALGFDLEDGMDVVASGDVDLFQRKGDVQIGRAHV